MMKIGIIGLGFVGSAAKAAYESCSFDVEMDVLQAAVNKNNKIRF